MNKCSFIKWQITRIYRKQKDNFFSQRFYQDICYGLKHSLGADPKKEELFSFMPKGCAFEQLFIINSFSNYKIEKCLENVVRSLLEYGKAYLYIEPVYEITEDKNAIKDPVIKSLRMQELYGYPSTKTSRSLKFYRYLFGGDITEVKLVPDAFIELKLTDIGYKKQYFRNMLRRLGKYDNNATIAKFVTESIEGYDSSSHSEKTKLKILKATKETGWIYTPRGLSNSHILYRKIHQDKLKLKLIDYIVRKINNALKHLLKNNAGGEFIAITKELDYDQIWLDFSIGKLTETELSSLLYGL